MWYHNAAARPVPDRNWEARSLSCRAKPALLACLVFILISSSITVAHAVPQDERRAETAQVKAQIDRLDEQLEIAAEDYNEARARYDSVTAKVNETEARLGQLAARQETLQTHLDTRVEGMYRHGPLGALELLLGATTFDEFAQTWDLLRDMSERDAAAVVELKAARAEAVELQSELAIAQGEAKRELDTMTANEAAIKKQLAERKRALAGIESEIARIEREAEEAAQRRAASYSSAADYGNPTNAPRSQVVAIALSKLGSPYRWAASGPDAFDCSGFTMWVYAQVGVSLPHSSRAQYGVGQRVSRANLQPGDLVFFGRSRIHHVGIYVGNGNYVHSPRTGDVVRVASLAGRSDYAGACRP